MVDELHAESQKLDSFQARMGDLEKSNFELLKHTDAQKEKIKLLLDENAGLLDEKLRLLKEKGILGRAVGEAQEKVGGGWGGRRRRRRRRWEGRSRTRRRR